MARRPKTKITHYHYLTARPNTFFDSGKNRRKLFRLSAFTLFAFSLLSSIGLSVSYFSDVIALAPLTAHTGTLTHEITTATPTDCSFSFNLTKTGTNNLLTTPKVEVSWANPVLANDSKALKPADIFNITPAGSYSQSVIGDNFSTFTYSVTFKTGLTQDLTRYIGQPMLVTIKSDASLATLPSATWNHLVTQTITLDSSTCSPIPAYTVTWKDYNGTDIETDSNVPYGSTPTYDSVTPTRPPANNKTYEFIGWADSTDKTTVLPSLPRVTGDATYYAVYETKDHYTIFWNNDDGKNLHTETYVPYDGNAPTYNIIPIKNVATQECGTSYTFSGWIPSSGTGYIIYTASYTLETSYPFTNDNPRRGWAEPYILNVYCRGLMNETSSTTFHPDREITSQEAIRALFALAKEANPNLTSANNGLDWALANNILTNTSMLSGSNNYVPTPTIPRQDMAQLLYNYYNYADITLPVAAGRSAEEKPIPLTDISNDPNSSLHTPNYDAIVALWRAKIIDGTSENPPTFTPKGVLNRAQLAKLISTEAWSASFNINPTDLPGLSSGTPTTVAALTGSTLDIQITNPIDTSGTYQFAGWYLSSDFDSKSYVDLESGITVSGKVTFYAKWELIPSGDSILAPFSAQSPSAPTDPQLSESTPDTQPQVEITSPEESAPATTGATASPDSTDTPDQSAPSDTTTEAPSDSTTPSPAATDLDQEISQDGTNDDDSSAISATDTTPQPSASIESPDTSTLSDPAP